MAIGEGLRGSVSHTVSGADTARELGSGQVDALGTPRLLAWCEEATVAALRGLLDAGQTSVGTRVQLEHARATPVGGQVTVTADLVHADGRLLRFHVVAHDSSGALVGQGEVTRMLVEVDRFVSRLQGE